MEVTSLFSEEEKMSLEGLLDTFSSTFSLGEIASAYCKAKRDADLAGLILCDLRHNTSDSSVQVSSSSTRSEISSESGSIFKKSSLVEGNSTSVANESCIATKPLKLDSKNFSMLEDWSGESSLYFAKNNCTNNEMEDFLFKMLGDGFQLDRDVIEKVLGCCGYDMQKSIQTLRDLSTVTPEKTINVFGDSSEVSTDSCQKSGSLSHVGGSITRDLEADGSQPRGQKGLNDLQHEILSALFHTPPRPEEFPEKVVAANTVKRPKASEQVVVEPLRDFTLESKTGNVNTHNDVKDDDEEDNYQVLRKAVREYRAMMKEYYKAAVVAFGKGDHALAGRLMEEGQFFHGKAREADEESAGIIFEARNEETETVSLELHNQGAREALRLLKSHLSSLSGIPSMKYLKVITELNDGEISKGTRKRLIIKLLEKKSISWIEGENPGTILIRLDEINPKHLSFARKCWSRRYLRQTLAVQISLHRDRKLGS